MTLSIFGRSTHPRTLERAWEKVRANGGCAGGDGITIHRFQHSAASNILILSKELRKGSYRPGRLRQASIPRDADEAPRILSIPCIVDRIAQGALAAELMPLLDPMFSEASFAYRPGRSVDQAVRLVSEHRGKGFEWVAESDVERCFDRIPHDIVTMALERAIGKRASAGSVIDLVSLWLEHWGATLGTPGRGLAQGSPISPLLANLVLDAADDHLDDVAGARLVRFADDFVILCRDRGRAKAALEEMRDALEEIGLTLNTAKTRITHFDKGVRFLGRLFVRSMVMREADQEDADTTELMRLLAGRDRLREAEDEIDDQREATERAHGLDSGSRALYLIEDDRRLVISGGAIVVDASADAGWREILRIPPARLDRIEVGPGNEVSLGSLRAAVDAGIEVHLCDGRGVAEGVLAPVELDRSGLHLDQARVALDEAARTDLARRFVDGRLRNQRAVLRRLNRTRKDVDSANAAARIGRVMRKLPIATDTAYVMGIEGEAAALYWPALAKLIDPPWAVTGRRFTRSRQPPSDPLNAVISYLSALLTREAGWAVRRAGLHPGFGALHVARDHGEACVYDLVEEFRAPLSESLTAMLFNNRVLAKSDFARAAGSGMRIAAPARRRIVQSFREALARQFRNPWSERQTTWGGMLQYQARAIAHHVHGDRPYEPYVMDY